MGSKVDYKRVMALGSWLTQYLSHSLSSWDIEQLADDALKLLNVDYVRSDNDPLISSVMDVVRYSDTLNEVSTINPKFKNMWFLGPFLATAGGTIHTMKTIETTIGKADSSDIDTEVNFLYDTHLTFSVIITIISILLKLQENRHTPWEYVLLSKDGNHGNGSKALANLEGLLVEYNNIREELTVKNRKIVIANKMVFPSHMTEEEWIRFPALASKIFITFLREGGRDYCGLCKNCNQFILAERKGQKQFCSGRCRIAYKRMKDKEKA